MSDEARLPILLNLTAAELGMLADASRKLARRREAPFFAKKRWAEIATELLNAAVLPPLGDLSADLLELREGQIVADADGFLWEVNTPIPGEVWLCPFDDRAAFHILSNGRTHATEPDTIPATPLRAIGSVRPAAAPLPEGTKP